MPNLGKQLFSSTEIKNCSCTLMVSLPIKINYKLTHTLSIYYIDK